MRAFLLALLLLAAVPSFSEAQTSDGAALPLGPESLPESRVTRTVAPGVTYTRIVRGVASAEDVWTIDAAVTADRPAARVIAQKLQVAGARARIRRLKRAPDDSSPGPLGFLVRTGRFETQLQADLERARLAQAGLEGLRTVFTAEDGTSTTGPWVVNVITADPGVVTTALATDVVPGRERLSALAARTGAVAAINGGYFVIGDTNGTDGDLAGVSVLGGALVSEAVTGRTSLLLGGEGAGARVEALSTRLEVASSDTSRRLLDGLNRAPGLIRSCGGSGGDEPTEAPKHDFTCTDDSELIRYTAVFGSATPSGAGAEAVLDAAGRVVDLRELRGGPIPGGGSVLSGTGEAAEWLREHAVPAATVTLDTRIQGEEGPIALGARTTIVNGGPRLLRDGRPDITAAAEGFDWPEDPGFFYRFGLRRNPRTLAGVKSDGRLLLVTVEGRRPGYSAGASFEESAAVMAALGADAAVNLDGGGSTGLTLGSGLLTWPSDATGERPIADALLVGARPF
jgi:hypothetical protein